MPAKAGTQSPPPGRPAPPAALDPRFRGGDDKRSQHDVSGSYHYDLPRIVEIYNHMVATLTVPAPRVAQSVVCEVRRAADSRSG